MYTCHTSFLLLLQFVSYMLPGQVSITGKYGVIHKIVHFYDEYGNPTFTDVLRIWYKDSAVIEEIHRINTVTVGDSTTVTYPLILCRYIHLRTKTYYDYKTFSDTAKIFNKAVLPDSQMRDYGWSFYSDKVLRIKGIPESLSDTVIDNITYKRVKFSFERHDPKKHFVVGYLRCDGRGELFSMEKQYSRERNCTMVKFFDFEYGREKPYASQEIEFVSDTLTKEEVKIFDVWEQNARQNPINK